MRTIFFTCFICICLQSFSQDDLPDARTKRESFTKMQEKDLQADLATFTMAGIDQSVGKIPLQSLPITKYTDKSITFSDNDLSVTINAGVFFATKHKLGYDESFLVKIDNKAYFGNYGKMPQTGIAAVFAVIGADTVYVPAMAIADIYHPEFTYTDGGQIKSHNGVYLSADKKTIYIYLLSLDEAGSYEVTWIIRNKQFVRRVVDYGFQK